ncbi:MAG: hypothetical protein QOE91_2074 [Gaiellaceae bacterium]|nr:hypothetical protein [Gaiellaceae bacterium]
MAGKLPITHGSGGALALALGAAALALPAAAGSAPRKLPAKVGLGVAGGGKAHELACGKTRSVREVRVGQRVVASVRVANRRRGSGAAALRRARLQLDRCDRGRWRRSASVVLGLAPHRRGGVRRFRRTLELRDPEVLRVRAVVPGDSRRPRVVSSPAYIRALATDVVDIPVSFRVVNRNGSSLPCMADGKSYDVRGRLIGSRTALGRGGGIAVYLHQIGLSSQYWNFKAVPGYDFAGELARRGHVSLVLDQLGYGASSRADGTQVCYGSEADMASQIARRLKQGDYDAGGGQAARFSRVALGSNGAAGFMVQPAAYSTGNVDALVVTGWADQGYSQTLLKGATEENATCASGGQPKDGQPGYVYTPPADIDFGGFYFADGDPRVVGAARALRVLGPCGEPQSALAGVAADQAHLREVQVPVLLVYGTKDAFFDDPRSAGASQRDLYSGSRDATLAFIEGAGQALALERSAPRFRDLVSDWLAARGF